MNRATAQNQSEQAQAEGLEPTKEWVKDLIDAIVAEEFASPDLELAWLDEDEADPKGLEAVLEGRLKLGAVTLNEMRDALGLDPYANAAADRPMVLTASGYVPIEANTGGENSDAGRAGANAEGVDISAASLPAQEHSIGKGYNPEEPRVPKHHVGGGEWTRIAASNDPNEMSGGPWFPSQPYAEGHHWVPRSVFRKRNFSQETKAVFEKSTSGPLGNREINFNIAEHMAYNEAVDRLLDAYLQKNKITEEQMAPVQAQEFVQEVLDSGDLRIRSFVRKIRWEAMRYNLRYGPLRRGGGDDPD